MAVTSTPIFTQKIHTQSTEAASVSAWTPSGSTTTNLQTAFTAGSNGSRVTSLIVAITDTTAVNCFIVLNGAAAAGTLSIIGQVNIPVTSGTVASTPAVDLLSSTNCPGLPIDNNGKRYIHLEAGDVLYVGVVANMTSGKLIFINAIGEDY